jgi:hypothetical protein
MNDIEQVEEVIADALDAAAIDYQRDMKHLLRVLARALHEQADERRERAMVADQQRDGSVPEEVVDRWASSFATAYQTLRGAAQAVDMTADYLETLDRLTGVTPEIEADADEQEVR